MRCCTTPDLGKTANMPTFYLWGTGGGFTEEIKMPSNSCKPIMAMKGCCLNVTIVMTHRKITLSLASEENKSVMRSEKSKWRGRVDGRTTPRFPRILYTVYTKENDLNSYKLKSLLKTRIMSSTDVRVSCHKYHSHTYGLFLGSGHKMTSRFTLLVKASSCWWYLVS